MKKSEFIEIERKIKNELENTYMLYKAGQLSKYSFQIFLRGVLESSPKYYLSGDGDFIELSREDLDIDFIISKIDDIDNWDKCTDTIKGSGSFLWLFVSDEIAY